MIPPIVDATWVAGHPHAKLLDVRWYPEGRDPAEAFAAGHLPGAAALDLDRWLAGPPSDGGGRHPLPDPATFVEGLRLAGVGPGDAVVGYDDVGGVIAARLVWMLRAWGLDAGLLDGGVGAWPGELATGPVTPTPAAEAIAPRPWPPEVLADIDEVATAGRRGAPVVLDARPADRYAGGPDQLDPRPGHIPGARSLPCREHLGPDGRLLPVEALRDRLASVGAEEGGPGVVSSCGSGVTACHTLVVMEHAGLRPGRLYPGSWSEWSRTDRPAATGPDSG